MDDSAASDFAASPATPFNRNDGTRNRALLGLLDCTGPAAPRRDLLTQASPQDALAAGPSLWRAVGLQARQVAQLQMPPGDAVVRALAWLAAPDHHLIAWDDPDYPPLLRHAQNPPLALFVAGDPTLLGLPAVAIGGSRSPTPGGADNAREFARVLARQGLMIASGLAAGIDTAVHESTLAAGGDTVAVMGTGPDVPYPRANTALHARIAAGGAVVSEHLPGTGPRREHFPSRNRIMAGLCLGTLVIEAAYRSGALITARLSAECGREVMAVPGSIHNPLARGCHRLIRDGACLIESPSDVADLLAPAISAQASHLRKRLATPSSVESARSRDTMLPPDLSPPSACRRQFAHSAPTPNDGDHHILWQALGHDPTDMDQLVQRTGLTPARLSSMLLPLELEGRVVAQHGRFHRHR
ncbi:DNA-processing protein DprA [Lysobacter sp. A03]|uniref:DNA-processing protein DprA n=1 Tax=Lysobacter sp. A03 TaxID=1199154 RepID=UPI0005B71C72|nr:DNA-processing protein DprA [Lysobacter sp. A03]KIQ95946.1 Rossmann fold nucleotide-binding protein Smf possibly involved in DNA uptake [Lysobacter sp. A03]